MYKTIIVTTSCNCCCDIFLIHTQMVSVACLLVDGNLNHEAGSKKGSINLLTWQYGTLLRSYAFQYFT